MDETGSGSKPFWLRAKPNSSASAPDAGLGRCDPAADEVVLLLVALDANVLDRTGIEQDRLIDRFRALAQCGSVDVYWPSGVVDEMLHLNAPEDIRAAASAAKARALARARLPVSARQQIDRIRVRAILRGDGRTGKHDADASHLSEAAEAGCRAFLTRDGKILRKRDTLRLALPDGMRILTLVEFLSASGEDMTDGARHDEASLWVDTSR